MIEVTLHFGDGTFHVVDRLEDEHDLDQAARDTKEMVESNAWFVATDNEGNESEEVHF